MAIKSITLSYKQVARILEAHINAEELKTPHRVTAVDPWDWDGTDEHQFAISLEPIEGGGAPVTLTPAEAQFVALPLHVGGQPYGANGNGHGYVAGVATAVTTVTPTVALQEATQAPPAERPKRRANATPEQRARVLELVGQGESKPRIAELVDLGVSTVYDIIKAAGSTHAGDA